MHSTSYAAQAKHFLFLRSDDEEEFPILERHFNTLLTYITLALRDPTATVYIHCFMGINRSATLAIAYAAHISGRPAMAIIEETRKATHRLLLTNVGFVRQLVARWPAT